MQNSNKRRLADSDPSSSSSHDAKKPRNEHQSNATPSRPLTDIFSNIPTSKNSLASSSSTLVDSPPSHRPDSSRSSPEDSTTDSDPISASGASSSSLSVPKPNRHVPVKRLLGSHKKLSSWSTPDKLSTDTSSSASSTSSDRSTSASEVAANLQRMEDMLPLGRPDITKHAGHSNSEVRAWMAGRNIKEIREGTMPSSADEDASSSTESSSGDSSDPGHSLVPNLSTSDSIRRSQAPLLTSANLTVENLSSLQARLHNLLPRMRAANRVLEAEREEGRLCERDIENVGDGLGYVEMNLGLGVLEEKDGRGIGSSADSNESETKSERVGEGCGAKKKQEADDNILSSLMGRKSKERERTKIWVQELGSE